MSASDFRLHSKYVAARWAATTRVDTVSSEIGLSFKLATGEVVALRLPLREARHLVETLDSFVRNYRETISQSLSSLGGAASESSQPEIPVDCVLTSSAAASAEG